MKHTSRDDEPRKRKTNQRLNKALLELLNEKPVNEITVKELTERAGVSRCVFYLHYDNLLDMLNWVEEEMFAEYQTCMRELFSKGKNHDTLVLDILRISFQITLDYLPITRLTYSDGSHPQYLRKYTNILLREVNALFQGKLSERTRSILFFYASGTAMFIREWIQSDLSKSPAEMAEMVNDIIKNHFDLANVLETQQEAPVRHNQRKAAK